MNPKDDSKPTSKKIGIIKRFQGAVIKRAKQTLGVDYLNSGKDLIVESLDILRRNKRQSIVETFEESCKRFDIKEKDLHFIYRQMLIKFYTLITVMVFVFFWVIYLASLLLISSALASIGVFVLATSLAISTSFRLYQINRRDLCSFKEWYQAGEFWPTHKIKTHLK